VHGIDLSFPTNLATNAFVHTMLSWEPVTVAVAVAIGLTILEIFLNRRRTRAKAKREASVKFRSAFFAESIAHFDNKDAYLLINQLQAKHDAAIIEFRPFVDPEHIGRFDATAEKFRRYRSELQPRLLKILAAIDSGQPADNSDRVRLKETLNELLTFAERN
jgi:hypothetical protein